MGVDGHMLLRMLEPAVRPGGVDGPARAPVRPFEQQSFEELLSQRMTPMDEDGPGMKAGAEAESSRDRHAQSPLSQLGQMGQIENASLRDLIVRHTQPGASSLDV